MTLEQLQARELELTSELIKLQVPSMIIAGVGSLGGVYYNFKTNGGFWRGVGFFLLGGFLAGIPANLLNAGKRTELMTELGQVKLSIMSKQNMNINLMN